MRSLSLLVLFACASSPGGEIDGLPGELELELVDAVLFDSAARRPLVLAADGEIFCELLSTADHPPIRTVSMEFDPARPVVDASTCGVVTFALGDRSFDGCGRRELVDYRAGELAELAFELDRLVGMDEPVRVTGRVLASRLCPSP